MSRPRVVAILAVIVAIAGSQRAVAADEMLKAQRELLRARTTLKAASPGIWEMELDYQKAEAAKHGVDARAIDVDVASAAVSAWLAEELSAALDDRKRRESIYKEAVKLGLDPVAVSRTVPDLPASAESLAAMEALLTDVAVSDLRRLAGRVPTQDVRVRLIEVASDPQQPESSRVAALEVLGGDLPGRNDAALLLLASRNTESERLREAALTAVSPYSSIRGEGLDSLESVAHEPASPVRLRGLAVERLSAAALRHDYGGAVLLEIVLNGGPEPLLGPALEGLRDVRISTDEWAAALARIARDNDVGDDARMLAINRVAETRGKQAQLDLIRELLDAKTSDRFLKRLLRRVWTGPSVHKDPALRRAAERHTKGGAAGAAPEREPPGAAGPCGDWNCTPGDA